MQKFEDNRIYMNTNIRIQVLSDKGTVYTREIINKAYEQFTYIVTNFTRFQPDSQLSKFNHNSTPPISKELFFLVEYALQLAHKTNGKYDPTILDLLETYGFNENKQFDKLSDKNLFSKIKKIISTRGSYKDIILNKDTLMIKLLPNQKIDLGSLGKGYAVKLASQVLNKFDNFLIEAGGDVYARGKNENNKPWKAALVTNINTQNQPTEILGYVDLTNQSLCSSGGWANKYRFFHHLINTNSGLPENKIKQIFVLGDDPLDADAWSTALYLTGQKGLDLIKNEGLEALIIDGHDKIIKSENFGILTSPLSPLQREGNNCK